MSILSTARGFFRASFLHGCHALAFLSRLNIHPCRSEDELREAVPWFTLAGLILGASWSIGAFCLFQTLEQQSRLPAPFPALISGWG